MWPDLHYTTADSTLERATYRLTQHIEDVPARLSDLSEDEWQAKLPRKWSKKELLGHLVDSALNNLKRFTEAQFGPEPYTFASYRQNELVLANAYQHLPVEHLLTLWQSLNRQIVYVIQCRLVKGRIALGVASFAYLSRKHGASFKPVHFAGLSV